ncbi:MAG: ABC transporter ATP-binding protein [Thiotrichaceae bacterium]
MDVIKLENVSKTYTYYAHGVDRLLEIITRHAVIMPLLHYPFSLTIYQGQVVGIIGNNGAGKSTLLKLIAGTIRADVGSTAIHGRVAALLELGTGFHPDMTGKENVYLSGTMMGLSLADIEALYPEIVAFADIGDFMEQPVKTYSSGMFMRLAFAVATCVEPDILIVDEALSVGDGAFARKSFNRFMQFKQSGKTILFCSHSMYQVESICDRVLWLDKGQVRLDGIPSEVISAYNEFSLNQTQAMAPQQFSQLQVVAGTAKIDAITVAVDGVPGKELDVISQVSELCITVGFRFDSQLPPPSVALVFFAADGRIISSTGSKQDGLTLEQHTPGQAKVRVSFPQIALLKGEYWLDVYLLCENALHVYDHANTVASLKVRQKGLELGVVMLTHRWEQI